MFSPTAIIIEPQDRDSPMFLHLRNYTTRSAPRDVLGFIRDVGLYRLMSIDFYSFIFLIISMYLLLFKCIVNN